jgi:hypothetical protein
VMPPCRQVAHTALAPTSSTPPRAPCATTDLHAGVELHNDEPPFVQTTR